MADFAFLDLLLDVLANIETQVNHRVCLGRHVLAASAGDVALQLAVVCFVDDAWTALGKRVILTGTLAMQLIDKKLEVFVRILLSIACQGLLSYLSISL